MSDTMDAACGSLDLLSSAVLNGFAGDQTFASLWGWNCVPLTRHDLVGSIKTVSDAIRSIPTAKYDKALEAILTIIPDRVAVFNSVTLPNLYNGNCSGAVQVLQGFLSWISTSILPYVRDDKDWTAIENHSLVPIRLLRRLRSIDSHVTDMGNRSGSLDKKILVIESAFAAAESLPTDLESLNETRRKVSSLLTVSVDDGAKIKVMADQAASELAEMTAKRNEAVKLVQDCEDAYGAATTKGLGEAFATRASQLSKSMWVWVGGLLISLLSGVWIGHQKIDSLQTELAKAAPNSTVITVDLILALFSIAAPVWFAWIATKQIGQRFRLSEDYGFKAAVAKAYEGYRREASRLDPEFAARLFSSTLSRIEEAPLRFVENDSHGSPWHELAGKAFSLKLPWGSLTNVIPAIPANVDVKPAPSDMKVA